MKKTDKGRERIWSLTYEAGDPVCDAAIDALSAELHISPVTARLLYNRGYVTPLQASVFLANDGREWHDPFLMADMEAAVARVLTAVEAGETIAIYGDYDVDGVTSLTSLYLYLTELGARVLRHIPDRCTEGYGMSRAGVEKLAAAGANLIVTVDTGITANAEVAYAASLGVDTVVTDHHECHGELPVCCAVVNPHRPDCPYPFKELAGVGVVFKFLCACETARLTRLGTSADPAADALADVCRRFVDLVAVGTVADVMPLTDENRFIVSRGLSMLDTTERVGMAALLDAISGSGNKQPVGHGAPRPRRKVNTGLVGFGIAPRINAAGRISHAMKAVDLLLSQDPNKAVAMAAELCEINARRQSEENLIAEQAYRMIEDQLAADKAAGKEPPRVLVLEDDGWMQGIIGIVSSRITETYGLPSILITFEGATVEGTPSPHDVGKGSGRSVKGLNLVEALSACEDQLVRFGGHELAAGLSLRRADIPAFRERINAYAAERLTDEMTALRYEADCAVSMGELSMELVREMEGMEPFGVANPTPTFMMHHVTVQKVIPLGGGKHTKLIFCADGAMINAVWFGMSPYDLPVIAGDAADVLFQLNINDYQGVQSLQMIVRDLRPSEQYRKACLADRARYEAILGGAEVLIGEQAVPDRNDIARVYTLLRCDARLGHDAFVDRHLLGRINAEAVTAMSYVKLRLIMDILNELAVCRIEAVGLPEEGCFSFKVDFSAPKTSVDASELLRRVRNQQVAE